MLLKNDVNSYDNGWQKKLKNAMDQKKVQKFYFLKKKHNFLLMTLTGFDMKQDWLILFSRLLQSDILPNIFGFQLNK